MYNKRDTRLTNCNATRLKIAQIWIHSIAPVATLNQIQQVIQYHDSNQNSRIQCNITLRPDIHAAISSSKDQFIATQSATMKPQLLYAVKYAQDHITQDNETVLRMGWASLGKRMLGAPILGMFILTNEMIVRKERKSAVKSLYRYMNGPRYRMSND
jgi:hypothetical protein